jgi:Coenzyme PQQ synthesis protein D (PqqD)
MAEIEFSASFAPSDDVVSRRLDDIVVLIHLKTNRIFELNATGARLWELISAGTGAGEIREIMLNEFDVAPSELTNAIASLTRLLASEELIAKRDAG